MKKTLNIGKLKLSRETLSHLGGSELRRADGGLTYPCTNIPCNTLSCHNVNVSACFC